MENKTERQLRQTREHAARRMFQEAHEWGGEVYGFLWYDVNRAIVDRLWADGFTNSIGGIDDITKGLVSMAARIALDFAKQKYAPLPVREAEAVTLEKARFLLETDDRAGMAEFLTTAIGEDVTHHPIENLRIFMARQIHNLENGFAE